MWPYYPELLERPVPRYTSYPTAADFHDRVGPDDLGGALDAIGPEEPVSLYVHIPFCEKICWYCGCNTSAANRDSRLSAYLESLRAEAALIAERLNRRIEIGQIAFGGGSPNALAIDDFRALADDLVELFDIADPQISVELDPRGMTRGWAKMLGDFGTAKVSLGVQTLSPHVQHAIGRIQPIEIVERVFDWLREADTGSINFDLMYGLPGQSLSDLYDTLSSTLDMSPDRIALFGYAHAPSMIPRQRQINAAHLPDGKLRFAAAQSGYTTLVNAGYAPIGFDHFAQPDDPLELASRSGKMHRNFQGFTDDPARILIGLGATAISTFPDRILQNEKNSGTYRSKIMAGQFAPVRGVMRTAEDRARAGIIEDLLCKGEAEISGLPNPAFVTNQVEPFRMRGLLQLDGNHIRLSENAIPYARAIAACFDRFREHDFKSFSNAI